MTDIEEIVDHARRFYGDLRSPKIVPNAQFHYDAVPRRKIEDLLSKHSLSFEDVTDLNEDRCVIYQLEAEGLRGVLCISFVHGYFHTSQFLISYIRALQHEFDLKFVDLEDLRRTVDVNDDFFAYDPPPTLENVLFSDYKQNWEPF